MVINTSAIAAILLKELDALLFAEAIENVTPRLMSAATLLEASMVIEPRKGEAGGKELDLFIYRAGIEIVPVDEEQAEVARIAWRQYVKGQTSQRLELRRLASPRAGENANVLTPIQGE